MTTTIYKFEEGRLLVHESTLLKHDYLASNVPFRIGDVRQVERVLSVTTDYAKYGLLTPLSEVKISGNEIFIVMRRGDLGIEHILSGGAFMLSGMKSAGAFMSGLSALGLMSGFTSGVEYLGPLRSGRGKISGVVTVTADVLGY